MGMGGEAVIVNAGGRGRGRGLTAAGGAEERPAGRSEIACMQHKYTPLDMRIIITIAAILLLVLLNCFIRWALRRFFLLRSQKPINPNKGLSTRQIQALPSFIYSSFKPPNFLPSHPNPPCDHPNFYLDPSPIGGTFTRDLSPISSHSCHNLQPFQFGSIEVDDLYLDPSNRLKVAMGDHNLKSPFSSSKVDEVHNDPLPTCTFLKVDDEVLESHHPPSIGDEAMKGNNLPTVEDEVAIDANSINCSNKSHVLAIDSEVKWNAPTFKSGHPMIGCTKINEMPNHGEANHADSPSPCPICLVDYVDGDIIKVLPSCWHYFHVRCIDTWLTKSSSCPACRENIVEGLKTSFKQPNVQVQVIVTRK